MKKWRKYMAVLLLLCLMTGVCNGENIVSAEGAAGQLRGSHGWLFYWTKGGGSTVSDYVGGRYYSKMRLKQIANNMQRFKKAVEKKGAKLVILMVPNKEVVYSNFMPKRIKRKSTYNRYDQLYDYLEANTDLDVCYPKKELLKQRNHYSGKYTLYYPTDSHWNRLGQYIGIQELMDITDGKKYSIRGKKFQVVSKYYGSDQHRLAEKVKKKEKSNKRIYLVGDSFSDCMSQLAVKFYKGVRQDWYYNFHMSKVKKGEIVVWECIERFQDRYAMVNMAAR